MTHLNTEANILVRIQQETPAISAIIKGVSTLDVVDNKVTNVQFVGGCTGNTQGVARLAEGRNIDEVIALLKGIQCRGGTSCPDQLARALEEIKQKRSA